MDLILKQFIPYKNIANFLGDYLTKSTQYDKNPNYRQQIIRKLMPIYLLILVESAHFTFRYLFPRPNDELELVTHLDFFKIGQLPRETNLMAIGDLMLCGYFLYILFFFPDMFFINGILFNLIIDKNYKAFFLTSTDRRKRSLCDRLRFFALALTLFLQFFIVMIDSVFIVLNYYAFKILSEYDCLNLLNFKNWLRILYTELNITKFILCFHILSYSNILAAVQAITFFIAVLYQLNQIRDLISHSHKRFKYMAQFKREQVIILNVIHRSDRVYSRLFIVFLGVNCPFNCVLVRSLLSGNLTPFSYFIAASIAFQQLICNLGIHLMIATINNRLHKPCKRFIQLSILLSKEKFKVKGQLQADNFIHAFHTKKKYGYTYHKMGLISMFAFTKYILLYSELLMAIYKFFWKMQ